MELESPVAMIVKSSVAKKKKKEKSGVRSQLSVGGPSVLTVYRNLVVHNTMSDP